MMQLKKRPIAIALVVALACVFGTGALIAQAVEYWTPKYDWYDGSGNYTLPSSAGGMQALSALVNGTYDPADLPESVRAEHTPAAPISFEGETITLSDAGHPFFSFRDNTWKFSPIGNSAEHVFSGMFDGNGNSVSHLFLNSESETDPCGTQYVGLFGHVGPKGAVKNFTLNDTCAVNIAVRKSTKDAAKQHVAYVGSLVGMCEGQIENCTSYAGVSVIWDDGEAGAKRPAENAAVIDGVGGIAGYCDGDISGCTYKGLVDIWTSADAFFNKATSQTDATVAKYVGGVVGRSGGDPLQAGLDEHGDVASCTNNANVKVVTSGAGGTDRFGEIVESKSYAVAGIAGYAIGNVSACTNSGDITATSYVHDYNKTDEENTKGYEAADGGADSCGGIVGGFRSETASSSSAYTERREHFLISGISVDRGIIGKEQTGAADEVAMSDCLNTGQIIACNNVGGIAGVAGTYTTVTRCANGDAKKVLADDEVGRVMSTRWNKVKCGGIVGNNYGTVSYSRNHGEVLNTDMAYYVGGIIGDQYFFNDANGTPYTKPETFASYSTGQIVTVTHLRRGAIAGGNGGYIHDCLYLYGSASARDDDDTVNAIGDNTDGNSVTGTFKNLSVAYPSQGYASAYQGIWLKSSAATAWLNASAQLSGWDCYWMLSPAANNGYPVLSTEGYRAAVDADLESLNPSVELLEDARYTAATNPVPKLSVKITVNGSEQALVENADYYVVPDANALDGNGACKGVTKDRPYHASVVGLGGYSGALGDVTYGIEKGDFSECTVVARDVPYTGEAQNSPEVVVRDTGGGVVNPDDYDIVVNNGDDCVAARAYGIFVTARDSSNYSGQLKGTYSITKVDIATDCDVVGLTWGNRVWFYDDESYRLYEVVPVLDENGELTYYDENYLDGSYADYPQIEGGIKQYEDENGRKLTCAKPKYDGKKKYGMAVEYTGDDINPPVIGVRYLGKPLMGTAPEAGHLIVHGYHQWVAKYGGASDDISIGGIETENKEVGSSGSVTVRYFELGYLQNYIVMRFDIVPLELKPEDVRVEQDTHVLLYNQGREPTGAAVALRRNGLLIATDNYDLIPDYSLDGEGNRYSSEDIRYELGYELYYRVHFKAGASVCCDDVVDTVHFTITEGKKSVNDASVLVNVITPQLTWELRGVPDPQVAVKDAGLGRNLIEGVDYSLYWPLAVNQGQDFFLDDCKGKVPLQVIGQGDYSGVRIVDIDVKKGIITASNFDPSSSDYYPELAIVNGTSIKGYTTLLRNGEFGEYEIQRGLDSGRYYDETGEPHDRTLRNCSKELPWVSGGYTREMLTEAIYLCWRSDPAFDSSTTVLDPEESGMPYGASFGMSALQVDRIVEEKSGREVERASDIGEYTLSVSAKPDYVGYRMQLSPDIKLDVSFRIIPIDLSSSAVTNGYPQAQQLYVSGTKFSSTLFGSFDGSIRSYTGKPQLPDFRIVDYGLVLERRAALAQGVDYVQSIESHMLPRDSYGIVVDGYGKIGPTSPGKYYIRGYYAAEESSIAVGSHDRLDRELVDDSYYRDNVSFSIVAADISNSDIVDVRVDAASFTGSEVTPTVRFFIDGEECNYVEGEDYELEYSNNVAVATADSDAPPTVKIRILNTNHLTSNQVDVDGVPVYSVPFTIKPAPVQMQAVEWDLPEAVSVAEGTDGQLSAFVVNGIYANEDGVQASVPRKAYTIEAGTYTAEAFAPKQNGWTEGEGIAWRITATDDSGDYTGSTVITGVSKVAVAPLSFSHANEDGSALSAALSEREVPYTGAEASPQLHVMVEGVELRRGHDFSVKREGGVDVGVAKLVLTGMGAYTGTIDLPFEIVPADISGCDVSIPGSVYSGESVKPAAEKMTVSIQDAVVPSENWNIVGYGTNIESGTGTVSLRGVGNLTGESTFEFVIARKQLDSNVFSVEVFGTWSYTGKAQTLSSKDVKVTDNSTNAELEYGADYRINYTGDNVSAGKVPILITGVGNYSGSLESSFRISQADISAAEVSVQEGTVTDENGNKTGQWLYTGEAITPSTVVELDGAELQEGVDYRLEYADNVDVSTGGKTPKVTAVGIGNCSGRTSPASFDIAPAPMSAATARIVQATDEYPYSGAAVEPVVTVLLNGRVLPTSDYRLHCVDETGAVVEKPVERGEYAVVAESSGGNVEGRVQGAFYIIQADIATCAVGVPDVPVAYDGTPVEAPVTVTSAAGVVLDQSDYVCIYSNNTELGATGRVTVTGKNNLTGSTAARFKLTKIPITADDVTFANGGECFYTGKRIEPTATVTVAGRVLAQGEDYQLSYLGDATSVGRQTVEVVCPEGSLYSSNGVVASYFIVEKEQGSASDAQGNTSGAPNAVAEAKKVKTVTVNRKTVTATAVAKAVASRGGKAKTVTKIILGPKVKTVKASAFKGMAALGEVVLGKNVKTLKPRAFKGPKKLKLLTIKTKKLTKKSVKKAFVGSKLKTAKVRVGSKKLNKKFVKKYKKVLAKKICGRGVRVK